MYKKRKLMNWVVLAITTLSLSFYSPFGERRKEEIEQQVRCPNTLLPI
jgi:hypothetical protein